MSDITKSDILAMARKYHTPGDPVKKDWHPLYKQECEKINREKLKNEISKKYERNVLGKVN